MGTERGRRRRREGGREREVEGGEAGKALGQQRVRVGLSGRGGGRVAGGRWGEPGRGEEGGEGRAVDAHMAEGRAAEGTADGSALWPCAGSRVLLSLSRGEPRPGCAVLLAAGRGTQRFSQGTGNPCFLLQKTAFFGFLEFSVYLWVPVSWYHSKMRPFLSA